MKVRARASGSRVAVAWRVACGYGSGAAASGVLTDAARRSASTTAAPPACSRIAATHDAMYTERWSSLSSCNEDRRVSSRNAASSV
eukprot:scaffold81484_cov31-Tisochrysis_lutea.AAC.12